MKYKAGFIGTGNMGGALATGIYKGCKSIALCNRTKQKATELQKNLKGAKVTEYKDIASNSEYVFLGMKPNTILDVAGQIKELINEKTIVVSMAAGITLSDLVTATGTNRCIRILPNTPCATGEGIILYCVGKGITKKEENDFVKLVSPTGLIDKVDEKLFDAAATLTGCGPAFAYMFAQSLSDGAVACGVPRKKALAYAAQMIKGSAQMMIESNKHPDKLKDEVCSPGGTTIEGVLTLEEYSFRAACANAIKAAYEKTEKLKK